jgi:RNA polymerase sigma factor (sigma-70 family)
MLSTLTLPKEGPPSCPVLGTPRAVQGPPATVLPSRDDTKQPEKYAGVEPCACTRKSCTQLHAPLQGTYLLALKASRTRAFVAARGHTGAAADRDDFTQEGLVACWCALPHFDANRASLPTYFERVISNRLASLIRSARTPLLVPLEFVEACAISSWTSHVEVRLDIERVLRQLGDSERRMAVALMEHSPAEVSRRLQIPRSTIYARMGKLRSRFVAAGFGPRSAGGRSTANIPGYAHHAR